MGRLIGWGGKLVVGNFKFVGYVFYWWENVDVVIRDFDVVEFGIGFEIFVFKDYWFFFFVFWIDNELMVDDEIVGKVLIVFSFNWDL